MFDEVLFALSGYIGDIVEENDSEFRVSTKYIGRIPKTDIDLLNKILEAGFLYKKLSNFIEKVQLNQVESVQIEKRDSINSARNSDDTDDVDSQQDESESDKDSINHGGGMNLESENSSKCGSLYRKSKRRKNADRNKLEPGLFIHALALGMDTWLDENYRQTLTIVEEEYYRLEGNPLSRTWSALYPDILIMQRLYRIIEEIETKNLKGIHILDKLWSMLESARDNSRAILSELFAKLASIWLRQVLGWLTYGVLWDPYQEFLVLRVSSTESRRGIFPEEQGITSSIRYHWKSEFILSEENFPRESNICSDLAAERILFLGKAVRSLEITGLFSDQDKKKCIDFLSEINSNLAYQVKINKEEVNGWGNKENKNNEEVNGWRNKENKNNEEVNGWGNQLKINKEENGNQDRSPKQTNNLLPATNISSLLPTTNVSLKWITDLSLDRIRSLVGTRLRYLLVEQGNLLNYFISLKGFFCCGFGPFFQTFLDSVFDIFLNEVSIFVESEIDHHWRSCLSMYMEELSIRKEIFTGREGISIRKEIFPKKVPEKIENLTESKETDNSKLNKYNILDNNHQLDKDNILYMNQLNKYNILDNNHQLDNIEMRILPRGFVLNNFIDAGESICCSNGAKLVSNSGDLDITPQAYQTIGGYNDWNHNYDDGNDHDGKGGNGVHNHNDNDANSFSIPTMVWHTSRQQIGEGFREQVVLRVVGGGNNNQSSGGALNLKNSSENGQKEKKSKTISRLLFAIQNIVQPSECVSSENGPAMSLWVEEDILMEPIHHNRDYVVAHGLSRKQENWPRHPVLRQVVGVEVKIETVEIDSITARRIDDADRNYTRIDADKTRKLEEKVEKHSVTLSFVIQQRNGERKVLTRSKKIDISSCSFSRSSSSSNSFFTLQLDFRYDGTEFCVDVNNRKNILYLQDFDIFSYLELDSIGCGFVGLVSLYEKHHHQKLHLLTWKHTTVHSSSVGDDFWSSSLALSLQVPWPLSLVIPVEDLRRYNRIFKLLFTYKRAHHGLSRVWLNCYTNHRLVNTSVSSTSVTNDVYTSTYAVFHNRLYFTISEILQYFQQDVVESGFIALKSIIDKPNSDFEDIIVGHQVYLARILSDCFLTESDHKEYDPSSNSPVNNPPGAKIHQCLISIVGIALKFLKIIVDGGHENSSTRRGGDNNGHENSSTRGRGDGLSKLESEFTKQIRLLLKFLESLESDKLQSLLLRLNYNDYFEESSHIHTVSMEGIQTKNRTVRFDEQVSFDVKDGSQNDNAESCMRDNYADSYMLDHSADSYMLDEGDNERITTIGIPFQTSVSTPTRSSAPKREGILSEYQKIIERDRRKAEQILRDSQHISSPQIQVSRGFDQGEPTIRTDSTERLVKKLNCQGTPERSSFIPECRSSCGILNPSGSVVGDRTYSSNNIDPLNPNAPSMHYRTTLSSESIATRLLAEKKEQGPSWQKPEDRERQRKLAERLLREAEEKRMSKFM